MPDAAGGRARRARGRVVALIALLLTVLVWTPATAIAAGGGSTTEPLGAGSGLTATTTVLGVPTTMQVATSTAVSAAVTPVPDAGSVDFVDVTVPAAEQVLATSPVTADGVAIAQVRFPLLGTRHVVARYGGTGVFAPSDSTTATVAVQRFPVAIGQARLGSYAFNGAITAALRDPDTGVTYVGGDFTEVGIRTGPVAEVEPPGTGTGLRVAGSPEVVGSITASTVDGNGYLLFGDLVAVNGSAVPVVNGGPTPIVRIDASNHRDPSWNASAKGLACAGYGGSSPTALVTVASFGQYVVVPFRFARVDTALGRSSTGLALLDRASGTISLTGQGTAVAPDGSACPRLWPGIAPLPQLGGCSQCFADVSTLAVDSTTSVLLVTYDFTKVVAGGSTLHSLVIAGYDTAAGTRLWTRQLLGSDPPTGGATAASASPLPGAFLLTGAFPFETTAAATGHTTSTVLLDALTGVTRQRWTPLGEVALVDPLGDPITAATACLPTYQAGASGLARLSPSRLAGLGAVVATSPTTSTHEVCTYALDGGGRIVEGQAGPAVLPAAGGAPFGWPVWSWSAGGSPYLLGPDLAYDVDAQQQLDWSAEPSSWQAGTSAMLQVGGRLLLTGPFRFLHGSVARHLAAMDPGEAPLPGFDASLGTPADSTGRVTALALWQGRLAVTGSFSVLSGAARDGLGAIDPETGAVDPWAPDAGGRTHPAGRSLAVDPATRALYVSGASCLAAWTECPDADVGAVVRYQPIAGGGALDPAFAPVLACNPDGNAGTLVSPCPNVSVDVVRMLGGDVFIGGDFSAVAGKPRQGLARLGTDGSVRPWAPPLFTQMDPPPGGELFAVMPREILLDGNRVLVAGRFETRLPSGSGTGTSYPKTPIMAWSADTSARVYPMPSMDLTGLAEARADGGYDAAIYGSAVVVALGRRGVLALDRSTFHFDPTANPYLLDTWWPSSEGVFALGDDVAVVAGLAAPSAAQLTVTQRQVLAQAVAGSAPIIVTLAGAIARWDVRTAGDLLEVGLRAPDVLGPVAFPATVTPTAGLVATASSLPVTIAWPPAFETGSGLNRYELEVSTNSGGYRLIRTAPLALSGTWTLVPSKVYRFRVRAVDRAGNGSAWKITVPMTTRYVSERSPGVTYGGGAWTSRSLGGSIGGSVRSATAKGAWAKVVVTARSFGVVTSTGPSRGTVSVWVDNRFAGTVVLTSPTVRPARLVFARWLGSGTHTILVRSLGTSRVDLDGFQLLR